MRVASRRVCRARAIDLRVARQRRRRRRSTCLSSDASRGARAVGRTRRPLARMVERRRCGVDDSVDDYSCCSCNNNDDDDNDDSNSDDDSVDVESRQSRRTWRRQHRRAHRRHTHAAHSSVVIVDRATAASDARLACACRARPAAATHRIARADRWYQLMSQVSAMLFFFVRSNFCRPSVRCCVALARAWRRRLVASIDNRVLVVVVIVVVIVVVCARIAMLRRRTVVSGRRCI